MEVIGSFSGAPGQPARRPTIAHIAPAEIDATIAAVVDLQPTVVLVEGVALLPVAEAVRRAMPAVTLIIDFHNVESVLYREISCRRWPLWLRPLRLALIARSVRRARQDDAQAIALADQIWTCSARDATAARALGARSVAVVPNPIPPWCAAADTGRREAGSDILFVGELGYAPNKSAVRLLVTAIMPRLKAGHPDLQLHVTGREPYARLSKLVTSAGHRLTANPVEVAPAYAQALAAVIPLTSGGGTRIKVIEALAVGCPVIATAKAVEGLGLEPGVHYLAAERPAEFARAIGELADDDALGRRLGENGRALVQRHFGPEALQAAIAEALAQLESSPPPQGHPPTGT